MKRSNYPNTKIKIPHKIKISPTTSLNQSFFAYSMKVDTKTDIGKILNNKTALDLLGEII